MNAAIVERFFGLRDAFAHPLTCGVVAFVAAMLIVTPLIFVVLRRPVTISDATYSELWSRWRSWIVITIALIVPILLGAAWIIVGVFGSACSATVNSRAPPEFSARRLIGLAAVVTGCC